MAINKSVTLTDCEALKRAAADYHARGFNCAQSVICAFAPALDIDEKAAFALSEGFGVPASGRACRRPAGRSRAASWRSAR